MTKETEISIVAVDNYGGAKYDEAAKVLFLRPEILAPILNFVVPEYKDYTVEEIIGFIDKNSIQDDPIDAVSRIADCEPTEMVSLGEKLIRYDSHFKAINPLASDETVSISLHIDLEVQNDYRPRDPKYPIVKRGIYYAARGISSQLGILTDKTDYDTIEKVYSIWICNENIPTQMRNTVTSYSVVKKDEVGVCDESEVDYDLMTVIIIRRGDDETSVPIFDYLAGVFNSDRARIRKYVDIKSEDETDKEIRTMTGLGQSIYVKGMNEGIKQGIQQGIHHGEQMLATLINKLSSQGRVDEALKVASDEELRKKLYKEFGMIEE